MFFRELNHCQCKTYLIACEVTRKAILVDPISTELNRYLALLAYHQFQLVFVADTHTHADHRSACFALKEFTDVPVYMHTLSSQPHVDKHYEDGDELKVGEISIKVLHTPGHTPDSVSFYVQDRVLTGDVLLIQGTGRADFAGGDPGQQYDSITQKLFTLPDETLVFPAHDYRGNKQSTIGTEKTTNPRIAGKTRDEYIDIMNNLNLPLPERIQEVLQINQSEIEDDRIKFPSIAELNQVMQLDAGDVHQMLQSPDAPLLIDVREDAEIHGELGHIAGIKHIPLAQMTDRMDEIQAQAGQSLILVCRSGVRSTTGAAILTGLGYDKVFNLKGGMVDWNAQKLPVEY